MKFDKKKLLFFLLFIIPSIRLVYITNNLVYPLIQNNEIIFKIVSYLSLVIFTLFFVIIYSFIETLLPNKYQKIFRIIAIIISVFFIILTLMNILVYGLFRFESCGKEFNKLYIESAKSNDSSFCLNPNIKLNRVLDVKGKPYCKTPNKDIVGPDHFEATCITSFAKYTNDISHCNIIESKNLILGSTLSESGLRGNKYHCIMQYAVDKLEPSYCDLLPKEGDYSDRNQCLKIISLRLGDKSLCQEILSSSPLKKECLK